MSNSSVLFYEMEAIQTFIICKMKNRKIAKKKMKERKKERYQVKKKKYFEVEGIDI